MPPGQKGTGKKGRDVRQSRSRQMAMAMSLEVDTKEGGAENEA